MPYSWLACVLPRTGHESAALETIDHALRRWPASARLHAERALYLHGNRRYDEEMVELEVALKVEPDGAEALFHRGLAYARRLKLDASIADLRHAAEETRGEPRMLFWLGRIALQAGRTEDAKSAMAALAMRTDAEPAFKATLDAESRSALP